MTTQTIEVEGLLTRNNSFVHGMSKTSTYKSWEAMIQRCSNASLKAYKNYGGRGIYVCKQWTKFENFYADMGIKPKGCSIDRIDLNGNYEPLNCRWSTMKQQNRNRRNNRLIELNGETMCGEPTLELSVKEARNVRSLIKDFENLGWFINPERALLLQKITEFIKDK